METGTTESRPRPRTECVQLIYARLLTSRTDRGLAVAAINADGRILFQRGADFDRLKVTLRGDRFTGGQEVAIEAATVRSRDLGFVPADRILSEDNRPKLEVRAALTPATADLMAPRRWNPCTLRAGEEGKYALAIPEDLAGRFLLRISATRADVPGMKPLAVTREVTIMRPGQAVFLQPMTDRKRTAFAAGRPLRLTVPVRAADDVDLSRARLELRQKGKAVWSAPLGLATVEAGKERTAVVIVPARVTALLRPGLYAVGLANLPETAAGGEAVVYIMDPVRPEAFQTPMHSIGPAYKDPLLDGQMIGRFGVTHVVGSAQADPIYLDMLARAGIGFHYQPYGHYAAVHTLPQEQGAARVWLAGWAQRLEAFPAFDGLSYHDLQVQAWGGWWDAPRKPYYEKTYWPKWAAEAPVPASVPKGRRSNWATAWAVQSMLTRMYAKLNAAVAYANPLLQRTTQQWWHQPLYIASPDDVCKGQTLITAQHMEEQYYHPVTVANMTDLWRRPGMDTWVYGNCSWQEDGSGALMYTDLMAVLFRGVQGAGRNQIPRVGDVQGELSTRAATAAFRLLHVYGGLSAAGKAEDQVAVWRSMYEECAEYPGRRTEDRHMANMAAAYTACLYAHRTAGIVTDDLVRRGRLKDYKAVIVSFEVPLPEDLLKPLREFQDAGGIVLANKPAGGYWAPPGAVELGPAFRESHAMSEFNRDSPRHIGVEEDGLSGAAAVLKALGDKVDPFVDCDEATTWLSVLASGKARYVWAVNVKRLPQDPMDLHRYSGYENTRLPVRVPLRIRRGDYVVYDVLAGRQVQPGEEGDRSVVTADMSVFPGAIFALVPKPIERVRLQARADGTALTLRAYVAEAGGDLIDAAVPMEITVADARGDVRFHLYRTAEGGSAQVDLPLAANDPPGKWTVTAQELLSGKSATGVVDVVVPKLPREAPPAPVVEWGRASRAAAALSKARKVAVVSKTGGPLGSAVDALVDLLQSQGKQVVRLSSAEYLADLDTLKWKGFPNRHGEKGDVGKIQPRRPKYDLVLVLETRQHPAGVVKGDLLPIVPTGTDPGPGRGLVQYVAMPVYNDEDALCISGGDSEGLMAAVRSLARPPAALPVLPATPASSLADLKSTDAATPPPGLARFVGTGVCELAVSPDARRIAVGLKGWGDNLIVLDGGGKVLAKDVCGKFFPLGLRCAGCGFAVLSHENDPTTMYLKLYDRDGRPIVRLAAAGRRIGGVRDCTPNFLAVMGDKFLPQSSFSVSDDLSLAAVAGSNGIAVWDMRARKVLWRDDTCHYTSPRLEAKDWPDAPSFPQVRLSGDGAKLILQHRGKIVLRDARTGAAGRQFELPPGSGGGAVRVFDGKRLVIGSGDYLGFSLRGGGRVKPLWHYTAPKLVTALAFCPDGLRYAVGEVDGTIRLMRGGGQTGGYVPPGPGGAIASLDAARDFARVAFASATGFVGVLDQAGRLIWQREVVGPAVIRFAGTGGASLVGDRRGIVRWFDADGKETRQVNLTPQVWRSDLAKVLTREDPTPALRLGPGPDEQRAVPVPQGVANLAATATFKYVPGRSWWNEKVHPDRSVPLNDGRRDAPPGGWYDRLKLEYLAFVPCPPAWEISWDKPVTVDTLVAYESADHPQAVPQEVRIDAWVEGNWKEIAHAYWNDKVVHGHRFERLTTTKLRYVPVGDLAKGIYLGEIEVYDAGGK